MFAACDRATTEPKRSDELIALDSAALFRTDAPTYRFKKTEGGVEGWIHATFTNRSGRAVSFVNCNGGTKLTIQRLDGVTWVPFWAPVLPSCLSVPITVPDGGLHTFDIAVFGGTAGSRNYPQFESPLRTALYRVVWFDAYFDYRNGPPWGVLVRESQRTSNSFVIRPP